jgi:hypothetical protein
MPINVVQFSDRKGINFVRRLTFLEYSGIRFLMVNQRAAQKLSNQLGRLNLDRHRLGLASAKLIFFCFIDLFQINLASLLLIVHTIRRYLSLFFSAKISYPFFRRNFERSAGPDGSFEITSRPFHLKGR